VSYVVESYIRKNPSPSCFGTPEYLSLGTGKLQRTSLEERRSKEVSVSSSLFSSYPLTFSLSLFRTLGSGTRGPLEAQIRMLITFCIAVVYVVTIH
jgi:hypothetical protein